LKFDFSHSRGNNEIQLGEIEFLYNNAARAQRTPKVATTTATQSSPLIKIQFNDSNAKVIAEHTVPGGGGTRREFPSNLLKQG